MSRRIQTSWVKSRLPMHQEDVWLDLQLRSIHIIQHTAHHKGIREGSLAKRSEGLESLIKITPPKQNKEFFFCIHELFWWSQSSLETVQLKNIYI